MYLSCRICSLSIKARAIPPSFQLQNQHTLHSNFHKTQTTHLPQLSSTHCNIYTNLHQSTPITLTSTLFFTTSSSRPRPIVKMTSEAAEQSHRILAATVDIANTHISVLNALILEQKSTVDSLLVALERIREEKAEVLTRAREATIEIWRLKGRLQELQEEQGRSKSLPDDQERPGTVAMARQRGYMGHFDRPATR